MRFASWMLVFGSVCFANTALAQLRKEPPPQQEFDIELARQALRDIGADLPNSSGRCAGCHDPNMIKIVDWVNTAMVTSWKCDLFPNRLAPNADVSRTIVAPRERIDCMRTDPANPRSPFDLKRMGMLAAGVHTEDFAKLFREAYGATEWQREYQRFQYEVQMPRNENMMTQQSWDNVRDWMFFTEKSAPHLEAILGGTVTAPTTCEAYVGDSLKETILSRKSNSWATRSLQSGVAMFACDTLGADPLQCFEQRGSDGKAVFPDIKSIPAYSHWSDDYANQRLIFLTDLGFATSFWTRSSVGGRFIANGVADADDKFGTRSPLSRSQGAGVSDVGAKITDLMAVLDPNFKRKNIDVHAYYDPTFFPDDSGFLIQGMSNSFCSMTTLRDPTVTKIDFRQDGCSLDQGVNLYQSVGTSLLGGEMFAASGVFESDSGRESAVAVPSWLSKSYLFLHHILFDGLRFSVGEQVITWTPFQGDFQMSPSTELLASRVAGLNNQRFIQLGYSIEKVSLKKATASEPESIERQEVARLCHAGAKATFSYDERFLVTYAEVVASDFKEFNSKSAITPEFQRMIGSHNILLTDLFTGETRRITRMGAKQHAKFPHFRADGWLYFTVYDEQSKSYVMAASDAAIRWEREK